MAENDKEENKWSIDPEEAKKITESQRLFLDNQKDILSFKDSLKPSLHDTDVYFSYPGPRLAPHNPSVYRTSEEIQKLLEDTEEEKAALAANPELLSTRMNWDKLRDNLGLIPHAPMTVDLRDFGIPRPMTRFSNGIFPVRGASSFGTRESNVASSIFKDLGSSNSSLKAKKKRMRQLQKRKMSTTNVDKRNWVKFLIRTLQNSIDLHLPENIKHVSTALSGDNVEAMRKGLETARLATAAKKALSPKPLS